MQVQRERRFVDEYLRLTVAEQRQVDRRLLMLEESIRHPSLQARRWRGTELWYARVTLDLRMYFEIHEDYYLMIAVGHHDIERRM